MKFICTIILLYTVFTSFSAGQQNKVEIGFTCEEVEDMREKFVDKFS